MGCRKEAFLLFLILFVAASSVVGASGDSLVDVCTSDSDSDDLLQRNPAYMLSDQSSDSEYSDSEYDSESEDDDSKTALAKAMSKSRKAPGRTLELIKKHRMKITVAVGIYAFRRELYLLLLHFFGTNVVDQHTGKQIRQLKMKPTTILKVVIFVEVMRRLQSGESAAGPGTSFAALLLGGRQGLVFLQAFSALLEKTSNPAFIPPIEQRYTFERMNLRYKKDCMAFKKAMENTQKPFGSSTSLFGSKSTASAEAGKSYNGTVILFDLTGLDKGMSRMAELSDKVSFLLNLHRAESINNTSAAVTNHRPNTTTPESVEPTLEVVITLQSPGGSASDYGLAAQQFLRLRDEPGITLTICCDKIAASGGYMMACTSSPGHLFAAPFAVIGSIGVFGQVLNVHDTLQNWGVKPVVFRGGKHKAPLGLIGEVTDDAIATVQGMIDKTHEAFKSHVLTSRPLVAQHLEDVSTGEVWLGSEAIKFGLVDRVVTSDEYIGERMREGARVLKLINYDKKHFRFGQESRSPWMTLANTLSTRVSELRRVASQFSGVLREAFAGEYDGLALSAASKAFGISHFRSSNVP